MNADRSTWRRVVLPTEHGGWAFLAEPLLLGSLMAPSLSGALLGVAALATFLSRQPLRTLALDRRRGRVFPRTRVARRSLAAGALIAASATAVAVLHAAGPALVALAVMVPLAAIAVAFDLRLKPRHVAAELAGALSLGGLATAIALAGGWPPAPAFGLWGVLAARSGPSILYVRARLRLERGVPVRSGPPIAAAVLTTLGTAWLAALDLVPWLSVAAIGLLALRAAHGLSRWRLRMRTSRLGLTEIGFGLLTVLAVVWGMALQGPRKRSDYFVRTEPIMWSKSDAAAATVTLGPVSLKNTRP